MRKIILMAVAGYLWKKFKANRAATPLNGGRPGSFGAPRTPVGPKTTDFS